MKKARSVFSVLLIPFMLFTGYTPQEKESDNIKEQSGSPERNHEQKDEAKDFDFHIEFVPDGE